MTVPETQSSQYVLDIHRDYTTFLFLAHQGGPERSLFCRGARIEVFFDKKSERVLRREWLQFLSSLRLSGLLHIHAISSVHVCRSRLIKLCAEFGGIQFLSWMSSAKS